MFSVLKEKFWEWVVQYLDRNPNNFWFGGRDETISGRLGRRFLQGKCPLCGWICRQLDAIDPGHCAKAYIGDRKRNPDLPV